MPVLRQTGVAIEQRCERRFTFPALELVIGDEHFRPLNWSMRGALLHGVCDAIGVRVRGEMGVPGSSETIAFAATVIRSDPDTGNSAICFEDCRTERIEFTTQARAAALQ